MPELQCEHCGTMVLVRGLAAVCPNCKELVTPPPPSMTAQSPGDSTAVAMAFAQQPLQQQAAQAAESAGSTIQVPPVTAAPSSMRAPPLLPEPPPRPSPVWKIVGITLAVAVLALLLIDYVRLRLTRPAAVTVVTSAPAPVPSQSPSPATRESRASIFQDDARATPTTSSEPARATNAPRTREEPKADPPPPTSPPAPATRPAPPQHPYAHLAEARPVIPKTKSAERIGDDEIGQSIQRGVNYLLGQFSKTRLKGADRYDPETFAGLNALCVYALLHAGQAISDQRLNIQNEEMKGLLARVKEFPMEGNRATYSRALRISALAVYDRPEDRAALDKDAQWLLTTSIQGAYTYGKPEENASRGAGGWDNSNSQYGVLGIWAAAEAGVRAPPQYWSDVQSHWAQAQTHSGGWGYGPGAQGASLAMTSAGVTSLFIAREQLGTLGHSADEGELPQAIQRGLEWLDEGDNSINIDGGHKGYTLYGLERAGLASGYKFFGKHDWYLELAAKAIAEQRSDGSWERGDGELAETAFTLLFLSRGRHPIFVSKLRFNGGWANRPRDIANLTRFAGRELERPLNWQTVGTERDWNEWTDSPVLFITSDQPPNFSDAEIAKLRAYVEAGGMIFTHAERNSSAFNRYIDTLVSKLFPNYQYREIPSDHLIHSVMFQIQNRSPLWGVSNGSRLLLVHSPADLSRAWTVRPIRSNRPFFETAVNVIVYAAGRREFRNRLNTIYVSPPSEQPIATIPIARLKYAGNWDPEPGAWTRFARVLQKQTSLSVNPMPIDIADLKYETAPIAHLTGTDAIALDESQVNALRQFVARGGILFIDPCGGSPAFFQGVQKNVLAKMFPASELQPLDESHAILRGTGEAMRDLTKPHFRPYSIESRGLRAGQMHTFEAGKGVVIASELDVVSGLLGTGTWGIAGYQPSYSEGFARNLVLWTIARIRDQMKS